MLYSRRGGGGRGGVNVCAERGNPPRALAGIRGLIRLPPTGSAATDGPLSTPLDSFCVALVVPSPLPSPLRASCPALVVVGLSDIMSLPLVVVDRRCFAATAGGASPQPWCGVFSRFLEPICSETTRSAQPAA